MFSLAKSLTMIFELLPDRCWESIFSVRDLALMVSSGFSLSLIEAREVSGPPRSSADR